MICCLTALSRGTRSSPGVIRPQGCTGSRCEESAAWPRGQTYLSGQDYRTASSSRVRRTSSPICSTRGSTPSQRTIPPRGGANPSAAAVETAHSPQAVGDLDRDVLAVEVDVGVEDVGLHPPDSAVEGRVGAHR